MISISKCAGGIILGVLGSVIMVWRPFYFYSAWAFLLLFGLVFVSDKFLNAGIYGLIIVLVMAITNNNFQPLILLPFPILSCLIAFIIDHRKNMH